MIKPIETRYKGYRFRSRLEARWAVMFDKAGIEWIYEHQGFDLGGEFYLPDFWLPNHEIFVEIKPHSSHDDLMNALVKCRKLCDQSSHDVIVLEGDCWPGKYRIWCAHEASRVEYLNDVAPDDYGHSELRQCRRCDGLSYVHYSYGGDLWSAWGDIGNHTCKDHERFPVDFDLSVYEAARSARFEHGEIPN